MHASPPPRRASLPGARHRDHGHRSMRSYLKGTLNCSGTVANKIRRRADAMNSHPSIGDALLGGQIGIDQVDLLCKAHSHSGAGHRFAEFVTQLLDHAEHLEFGEFDTAITHFINQADPDGSFDDQQFQEDQRSASIAVVNGAVDVPASGVHDRWKHANKIRSRRAANNRIYLIRPDGTTIKPIGETEPDWAEPEPIGSPASGDDDAMDRPPIDADLTTCRRKRVNGWTVYTIDYESIRRR